MTQSSTSSDDSSQWSHIDVKQHWRDNQALRDPTIEATQGRETLSNLHSLGMVLQEGSEPGKHQATNSQLGEPAQEDTMVDGIKGRRDVEKDQQ